jgi:hypothetical protein
MSKQDDCYVDATPQERIAIIWELTAESAEAGCCKFEINCHFDESAG